MDDMGAGLVSLVLVIAPFVILGAALIARRGRGARVARTRDALSRGAAAGVFPASLRPPMDIEMAHEETPVTDEMTPEQLLKLRDTRGVELPDR